MRNIVKKGLVVWTPEMDRELWNQRQYGVHKNEIAASLGVSVAAADSRYFRLKREKKEQANDG
jgi:DNA-directed RNA polymerase specialized sigma24 family protein